MSLYIKFTKLVEVLSRVSLFVGAMFLPISTTISSAMFFSAIGFNGITGRYKVKSEMIFKNPMMSAFFIFFILIVIGTTYTTVTSDISGKYVLKYLRFGLVPFLLPILTHEPTRRFALYGFIMGVIITLFASYAIYFGLIPHVNPARASGVFKDYIQQGFLIAFTTYLLMYYVAHVPKYRGLIGLLMVFSIYNIMFINIGRSGYVIFSLLVFLYILQNMHWKKGIWVGLLSLILIHGTAYVFSHPYQERVLEASANVQQYNQGEEDTSIGLRLAFIKNSLKVILHHPFFGSGTGSFYSEYQKVVAPGEIPTANPHNEYLNIMVQLGLLGLISLCAIYYIGWRYSFFMQEPYKSITQAVTLAIVIGNCINSWMLDVTEGYFFVFFSVLTFSSLAEQWLKERNLSLAPSLRAVLTRSY